jgi:hypothetical protein
MEREREREAEVRVGMYIVDTIDCRRMSLDTIGCILITSCCISIAVGMRATHRKSTGTSKRGRHKLGTRCEAAI